jgi:hypothetical protein
MGTWARGTVQVTGCAWKWESGHLLNGRAYGWPMRWGGFLFCTGSQHR